MDKTEHTIRQLLAALPAPGYDIGVLSDKGMYRVEAAPASRVLRMLPFLKHRNAHGAHIYLRPTGESCYTLLDDLTAATLSHLTVEGYAPAAVVETSPGSFQAWLRHTQPLSKELGTLAAKTLAEQFGADRSAADWRRFGRAPGFTNRKPQHRNTQGFYPFAHLLSSTGTVFPEAEAFRARLLTLQQKAEAERVALRLSFATRTLTRSAALRQPLPLPHDRHITKAGQPPQIWLSASPPSLKAGPSPTLPPHSAANTSPAMSAAPVKPPTSAALFLRPSYGPPKSRGRMPFGFSPSLFPLF